MTQETATELIESLNELSKEIQNLSGCVSSLETSINEFSIPDRNIKDIISSEISKVVDAVDNLNSNISN